MVFRKVLESSSKDEASLNKVGVQCQELPHGRNTCSLAGQKYNVNGRILSHTCVKTRGPRKSANVRSSSVPRPQSKPGPYEAITKLRKTKSQSLQAVKEDWQPGATRIKRTKQTRCYPNVPILQNIDKDMPSSNKRENSGGSTSRTHTTDSSRSSMVTTRKSDRSSRSKTDEHEYLQFLLRITEDVIINNYFKNEDIQRVFKSHIEANRGRLQMEKMELQLTRLSKELNIPYTPTSPNIAVEKDATEGQKLLVSPIDTEKLRDCECGTKRNLQLISFPNRCLPYEDNNFASNLENILVNRHSLGRVTECTEPTNSLDTIYNANNRFSAVTVASSLGVDSLAPSNEQDVSYQGDKSDGSCNDGSSLTDKERIGSIEEDILFNKLHSRSLPLLSNQHSPVKPEVPLPLVATPPLTVDNVVSLARSDTSNKTVISRDSLTPEVVSSTHIDDMDTNIEPPRDERKHVNQDKLGKLKAHVVSSAEAPDIDDSLMTTDVTKVHQQKQQKEEKYTQIMIEHLEKECNTNKDVKIIEKDDNYVLINKPIYVLRNIVESKDGLVFFQEQPTSKDDTVEEEPEIENPVELMEEESRTTVFENPSDSEICIKETNLSDYSIKTESMEKDSLYNYSRLLNSDYDLTPQRDNNVDNKYHYLMLDVATSISNVNLPSNSDLLLTDKYALRSELSDKSNHHLGEEKEYCISDDGRYEIRSYNMKNAFPPRSAGNTKDRRFLQTSKVAKKISQLSISLSNYEIGSDISMSVGQYYDENSESESGLYPLAFDIPARK
ncbi:unnamed protein product [Callosobruchus maculatus]|uniref:Spermatogenesis-associated protein 7 n=1 Tax=Callosobruchus maculatus TaxID=64391 RepID=A0A653DB93_CALMS|nr:unnamed protein product [Callosobruchus maculatus]